MTDGWMPVATAPDGVEVMTKIDDIDGVRNVWTLTRHGRLWWFPDGSVPVHYAPTHWQAIAGQEIER